MNGTADGLLKPREAANILRARESTIRNPAWRERVGLKAVKLGRSLRFRETDIRALIERLGDGNGESEA